VPRSGDQFEPDRLYKYNVQSPPAGAGRQDLSRSCAHLRLGRRVCGGTSATVSPPGLYLINLDRSRNRQKSRLIIFKSHRGVLDGWAMKESVGHYVAYRQDFRANQAPQQAGHTIDRPLSARR
jgi:hypothetical protein